MGGWNKGIDNRLKGNCLTCNKEFIFYPSRKQKYCFLSCKPIWNKGKPLGFIPKIAFKKGAQGFWLGKKRLNMRGDKHPLWKGDKVGIRALHLRVERAKGKPNKCEFCGTIKGEFEWANKSHKYLRDLNDWLRLCIPCHRKYDDWSKKMWETRNINNIKLC